MIVCHLLLVSLTRALFPFSVFWAVFVFVFKVNIYHQGSKRISPKPIVCKFEVWWTDELPDQLDICYIWYI